MYCKNCGQELKETARFCTKCGQFVKKVPESKIKSLKTKRNTLDYEKIYMYIVALVAFIAIVFAVAFENEQGHMKNVDKFRGEWIGESGGLGVTFSPIFYEEEQQGRIEVIKNGDSYQGIYQCDEENRLEIEIEDDWGAKETSEYFYEFIDKDTMKLREKHSNDIIFFYRYNSAEHDIEQEDESETEESEVEESKEQENDIIDLSKAINMPWKEYSVEVFDENNEKFEKINIDSESVLHSMVSSNGIQVECENETIVSVSITDKAEGYSIYGAQCGQDIESVEKIIEQQEFELNYEFEGSHSELWDWGKGYKRDDGMAMRLGEKDGKASYIYVGTWL